MADIEISRFLRRLRRHGELSRGSAEAVCALPWRLIKRPRHSYVLREGDEPKEVSVLISGFTQRQKPTSEGSRQIMAFGIPGDPLDFDCVFLGEADFSVQMCTVGTVACVGVEALKALSATHRDLSCLITTMLLVDASVASEWVVNIGRRDARTRIAHLLCEIMMRLNAQQIDTNVFELPFTQEELGDATGLTPVHVNRILKQLTSIGAIERRARMLTVPDWEHLKEIADFDERFLHMS